MKPLVSVIIVNYNTFELTSKCIRSVVQHTNGPFEIILVDNASSECNPEVFTEIYPLIKIIRNSRNLGFAKANNIGIEASSGRFVLLLNSDAYLIEDSIGRLVASISDRPQVAIATCRLIFPDGKIQGCCQPFPSLFKFFFEVSRLQKLFSRERVGRVLMSSFYPYDSPGFVDWVWGTVMLIPKEYITKLPGQKLDEQFFMYCEDMQWCLDFHRLGYKIFYTPTTTIVHLSGGSSGKKNLLIRQNFKAFLQKNYGSVYAHLFSWIYRYYYQLI